MEVEKLFREREGALSHYQVTPVEEIFPGTKELPSLPQPKRRSFHGKSLNRLVGSLNQSLATLARSYTTVSRVDHPFRNPKMITLTQNRLFRHYTSV